MGGSVYMQCLFQWVVVLSDRSFFFPMGRCSFRWVCLCLLPSAVGLFVSGAFSGGSLFFPLGMFVSSALSGGFFRVWCLFR